MSACWTIKTIFLYDAALHYHELEVVHAYFQKSGFKVSTTV